VAATPTIRKLDALGDAALDGLADLTMDVVEGGDSIGFMHTLTRERSRAFWQSVAGGVATGERVLFVAEDREGICGTVQLVLAQMENQPHRADLSKLMVHRRARKRGVGEALMRAAEDAARTLGRTVLVLDTASADAERLYDRLGWQRVGVIPDYALWPEGGFCDTTVYYRKLER
jgi:ribosomal protein S18 acetylase RimI-like enzyme